MDINLTRWRTFLVVLLVWICQTEGAPTRTKETDAEVLGRLLNCNPMYGKLQYRCPAADAGSDQVYGYRDGRACGDTCQSDCDCPFEEKCCNVGFGCGHRCRTPVNYFVSPKQAAQFARHNGHEDEDLDVDELQEQMQDNISDDPDGYVDRDCEANLKKMGSCPGLSVHTPCDTPVCNNDCDCSGHLKCCRVICSSTQKHCAIPPLHEWLAILTHPRSKNNMKAIIKAKNKR